MKNRNVICFGETLWDVFPDEKKPGGAPMNVAVHLNKFGLNPKMVSRIGSDELGKGLLEFLSENEVDTKYIQTDPKYPTGVVNVQISSNGDANYDIVYPSAWDFIEFPLDIFPSEKTENVLVFGSLASRNDTSQNTLFKLLKQTQLALFDVNFREPYYSRSLVELLLYKSNIVKLNEHEIKIIGFWIGVEQEDHEAICHKVAAQYDIPHIVLTMGGDGAFVLKDKVGYRQKGFKVKVKDTVGSGDSFLASYLAHFLNGSSIEHCLEMACATGAFVASNHGAVPVYQIEDIMKLVKSQ